MPVWLFVVAAGLAVLAFMNARAGVGLMLFPDTDWGAGFDLDGEKLAAASALQINPDTADHRAVEAIARRTLAKSPLDAQAIRALGLALAFRGQTGRAETMMELADTLSRRDGIAQLWLAQLRGRQGDVGTMMGYLDVILRTKPETGALLFGQFAQVLESPDTRRLLVPYLVDETPWLETFFAVMLDKSGSVAPLGQLIKALDEAPRNARLRNSYASLIYRLAGEGEYALLAEIYPKLPGARPIHLTSVDIAKSFPSQGYRPVIWDFTANASLGSAALGSGQAEFFARGSARGIAGRKLIYPASGQRQLSFRKVRGDWGKGSEVEARLRCVESGAERALANVDMIAVPADQTVRLAIAPDCTVALLEIHANGGARRQITRMVLADFAFTP